MTPTSIYSPSENICKKDLAGIAQSRPVSHLATVANAPSAFCVSPVSLVLVDHDTEKALPITGGAFFITPNYRANVQRGIFKNLKYFLQVNEAEKFSLNQQNEYALKSRLSQYKIHLAMKHPPDRTYYGVESCTMQRIVNRRLPIVLFNGERGLANCVSIQQRYRGQYHQATIYHRHPGGQWEEYAVYPDELTVEPELPKPPAPVIMMRVFHDPQKGTITLIRKAA